MLKADLDRPGSWATLFASALDLMGHVERATRNPVWSFGGGTVLMLRINHRQSKDIDLFVPDPQYLGFVNPRLSDAAEAITTEYTENAEFIKLLLPTGEIDVVVGTPLTEHPFEMVEHRGRTVRVETNAEIVAKKMWHRGDRATARDLFDLCAVATADPAAIATAAPFMQRHGAAFLKQLAERRALVRSQFEAIDVLAFRESFDDCVAMAHSIVGAALAITARQCQDFERVQQGTHIGPILSIEDGVAVQRTNRNGSVVRHAVSALARPVVVGDLVEIAYRDGVGSVADVLSRRGHSLDR